MHIHIYLHTHPYTSVYMHICTHAHTYIHTDIYMGGGRENEKAILIKHWQLGNLSKVLNKNILYYS